MLHTLKSSFIPYQLKLISNRKAVPSSDWNCHFIVLKTHCIAYHGVKISVGVFGRKLENV
jgi:hypothetical protein